MEILAQISRSKDVVAPQRRERPPKPQPFDPETAGPFAVCSSVSRLFHPDVGFLKRKSVKQWDTERIFAPERAWPSCGSAAELYDRQREGQPAWKPTRWSRAGHGAAELGQEAARDREVSQGSTSRSPTRSRSLSAVAGPQAVAAAFHSRSASGRLLPGPEAAGGAAPVRRRASSAGRGGAGAAGQRLAAPERRPASAGLRRPGGRAGAPEAAARPEPSAASQGAACARGGLQNLQPGATCRRMSARTSKKQAHTLGNGSSESTLSTTLAEEIPTEKPCSTQVGLARQGDTHRSGNPIGSCPDGDARLADIFGPGCKCPSSHADKRKLITSLRADSACGIYASTAGLGLAPGVSEEAPPSESTRGSQASMREVMEPRSGGATVQPPPLSRTTGAVAAGRPASGRAAGRPRPLPQR